MKEFVDKLIYRLDRELKPDNECFEDEDDYIYAEERHNKMLNIVKGLAEEYNNGWISCSKDLPKERIDVLVWNSDQDMCCVAWYNSVTKIWYSNDFEIADSKYIVAWQPLPEPYKELTN